MSWTFNLLYKEVVRCKIKQHLHYILFLLGGSRCGSRFALPTQPVCMWQVEVAHKEHIG